ncbi:MAG: leucyl aminopeptidase [Candidatus Micrarchaeota archaeon]
MRVSVQPFGSKFVCDAAVFGVFEGEVPAGELKKADLALGGAASAVVKSGEFSGKAMQATLLHAPPGVQAGFGRILLIGLGKRKDVDADTLRNAAGRSAVFLRSAGAKTIASFLLADGVLHSASHAEAVVGATILSLYKFDKYKTEKEERAEVGEFALFCPSNNLREFREAASAAEIIANSANDVRQLLNEPANVVTPQVLAEKAREMAKRNGLKCRIIDEKEMRKLGMEALLAVSRGSRQPPTLTVLEYEGRKGSKPIAIVGKGITFDSGGISLKPSKDMDRMKYDKSGAVAVLGIMQAAAQLRLKVNLVGLMPASENLPGGNASKPGDIVRASNGKTIEILNTDAEGRLVLADALSYAQRYKPQAVIDLATLTGAVVVALGDKAAGALGNDEALFQKLRRAGDACGERVWQLPLWKAYDEDVKSDCADVKNIGSNGAAGTISGASFLKKFVGDYPWVHLDIAGTAWTDKERPYLAKGATGFGVRLVVETLRHWK